MVFSARVPTTRAPNGALTATISVPGPAAARASAAIRRVIASVVLPLTTKIFMPCPAPCRPPGQVPNFYTRPGESQHYRPGAHPVGWHVACGFAQRMNPSRDFRGYGNQPPDPAWPGGARVAVSI